MGENQSPIPRKESILFFENAIRSHSKVRGLTKINDFYYSIDRINLKSVKIFITNLYTIGLADYLEINDIFNDLDGIVTISNWNGYTSQVKSVAKKNRIGIFIFEEFMGALNINDIYNYTKRDSRGNIISFSSK
ncbi:hypothetical protein [Clostridium saccharoperbutylacetonicum]|uniref:hypothetical protein n=1 Tax=Clostridium saccharoperbutylacetonicum TaxID=36745 RepID=UPI0039E79991